MVKYLADFNFNNFAFDYESAGKKQKQAQNIKTKYFSLFFSHFLTKLLSFPPLR